MTDNEKLRTAIATFDATENALPNKPQAAYAVVEAARLALSVFEKAHTPTVGGQFLEGLAAARRVPCIRAVPGSVTQCCGAPTDDEREVLDQIVREHDGWWPETRDAILAQYVRRSEVLGGEAWQVAIEAERERQITKGYTAEHDARHGIRHLLCWAIDYDRRGKTLEASALKRAALDLLPREPQGEPSCEVPSWDTRVQKLREAVAAQTGSYLSIEGAEAILETVSPRQQGEPSDALTIPRPHVPYGPVGIPEHEADADYLEHAASSLESHYEVGGSNVRATVVGILRDVATALRAAGGAR